MLEDYLDEELGLYYVDSGEPLKNLKQRGRTVRSVYFLLKQWRLDFRRGSPGGGEVRRL